MGDQAGQPVGDEQMLRRRIPTGESALDARIPTESRRHHGRPGSGRRVRPDTRIFGGWMALWCPRAAQFWLADRSTVGDAGSSAGPAGLVVGHVRQILPRPSIKKWETVHCLSLWRGVGL